MAITAININSTRDYIAVCDRKSETPTIFKLGFIDAQLYADIQDRVTSFEQSSNKPGDSAKTTLNINQSKVELVRFGLKGVENLIDPQTKKPVEFKTVASNRVGGSYNIVAPSVINVIPRSIIYELAEEIQTMNNFSGEEEKN